MATTKKGTTGGSQDAKTKKTETKADTPAAEKSTKAAPAKKK